MDIMFPPPQLGQYNEQPLCQQNHNGNHHHEQQQQQPHHEHARHYDYSEDVMESELEMLNISSHGAKEYGSSTTFAAAEVESERFVLSTVLK